MASIPDNVSVDNKFGTYLLEITKEGNILKYIRKLHIKKGIYPKTDYNDYRNFRKLIASNDRAKAVLKKRTNE